MLATMTLRKQRLPRGGAAVRTPSMGMTMIRGTVQRPDGRRRRRRLTFLVDSGAIYSVLPARAWKGLGLTPTRHAEFALADGTTVGRGEEHDSALLGADTLETLGLMLNPLNRELLPMRLLLGRHHQGST
jgi:predicted aspartyl protease